jgi:type IV secretory pathway TraG/TraD family ATPase VirD4
VIFRALAQVMSLVTIVVLVRVLSEYDYGVYSLLYTMIAVIGMLFSFGIANTLQRYIPDYYSRGEFHIAHKVQKVSSVIRLFSNISIIFIFIACWKNIGTKEGRGGGMLLKCSHHMGSLRYSLLEKRKTRFQRWKSGTTNVLLMTNYA